MSDTNEKGRKASNPWMIIGWIILGFIVLSLTTCMVILGVTANAVSDVSGVVTDAAQAGLDDAQQAKAARAAAQASSVAPQANPAFKAQVISFNCAPSATGRYVRGVVSIRNTGAEAISMPQAYVNMLDASGRVLTTETGYFSPMNIPPGAVAQATVMRAVDGVASCSFVVQDSRGRAVDVVQP